MLHEDPPTRDAKVGKKRLWEWITGFGLVATLATAGHTLGGLTGFLEAYHSIFGFRHDAVHASTQEREAPRLSLVVLPFRKTDAADDLFAEGLAEDITNGLSRLPGTVVIAQSTAQTYAKSNADPRQIGRELNIRYVIQGSLRRMDASLAGTFTMVDAQTGAQLWVGSFNKRASDLASIRSELVAGIGRTLDIALIDAESKRITTKSPDSFDLTMRGWAFLNRTLDEHNTKAAELSLARAVAQDGNNIDALTGLAIARARLVINVWTADRESDIASAGQLVDKALSIDADHAYAHFAKGYYHRVRNELEPSLRESKVALTLNPSLVSAYGQIGQLFVRLGQFDKTAEPIDTALRLSPRDPNRNIYLFIAGQALLYSGQLDGALRRLQQSSEAGPTYPHVHALLAATYMGLNRPADAALSVESLKRIAPGYSIATYRRYADARHSDYQNAVNRVADLLSAAGLPKT